MWCRERLRLCCRFILNNSSDKFKETWQLLFWIMSQLLQALNPVLIQKSSTGASFPVRTLRSTYIKLWIKTKGSIVSSSEFNSSVQSCCTLLTMHIHIWWFRIFQIKKKKSILSLNKTFTFLWFMWKKYCHKAENRTVCLSRCFGEMQFSYCANPHVYRQYNWTLKRFWWDLVIFFWETWGLDFWPQYFKMLVTV